MPVVAPNWADDGPISQGKILTAILQGRMRDANDMLTRWNARDIAKLANAADDLVILCHLVGKDKRASFARDRPNAG